jgi:hypothetical protein
MSRDKIRNSPIVVARRRATSWDMKSVCRGNSPSCKHFVTFDVYETEPEQFGPDELQQVAQLVRVERAAPDLEVLGSILLLSSAVIYGKTQFESNLSMYE